MDAFGRPASQASMPAVAGGGWPGPPSPSRVPTQAAMPMLGPPGPTLPPMPPAAPGAWGSPPPDLNEAVTRAFSNPFAAPTAPPARSPTLTNAPFGAPPAVLTPARPATLPSMPATPAPPPNPFAVPAAFGNPKSSPGWLGPPPTPAPIAPTGAFPPAPPPPAFGAPPSSPALSPATGPFAGTAPTPRPFMPPPPSPPLPAPAYASAPVPRTPAPPPPPPAEDPLAAFLAPSLDRPDSLSSSAAAPPPAPPREDPGKRQGLGMELFGNGDAEEDMPEIAGMGGVSASGAPQAASRPGTSAGALSSAPIPSSVANIFNDPVPAPGPAAALGLPSATGPAGPRMVAPRRRKLPAALGWGVGVVAAVASFLVPVGNTTAAGWAFGKAESALGAAPLRPEGVRVSLWPVEGLSRPLLLVSGQVRNATTSTVPAVLVRAEFKDLSGAPMRQEETYAGHMPDELDLHALARRKDLAAELKGLRRRLAARDLAPGEAWPFLLVVQDPPEALGKADLTLTAHSADAPAGATGGAVHKMDLQDAEPAVDGGR